ncbi:SUKH-3 domain-containing protein [Dyadobacter sp. BHUBP1]|uniref:SUKH-3 domain-containing protein n=1 Tax=Dyadobacter sp. BHUBP1 TaxID=3424178 RepID=UPI003D34A392
MVENSSLSSLGWYPGRKIDVSSIKLYLLRNGFDWFEQVELFLSEFGNLRSKTVHFDPMLAERGLDRRWIFEDYAQRIKQSRFCVIGQAFDNHLTLFMGENGTVYGGYDDFLCIISDNPVVAITKIFETTHFDEIT